MEALIEMAFKEGGLALAFIVMLWAYRELWQRRFDELSKMTAEKDADRKILLERLDANTKVNTELVAMVKADHADSVAVRTELRGTANKILEAIQDVDTVYAQIRGTDMKRLLDEQDDNKRGTKR